MLRQEVGREAFDEALSNLLRGDSIETCLLRHRELAPELAPLLALAQELRRLAAERPDPAANLARARGRFLQLAAQARARQAPHG